MTRPEFHYGRLNDLIDVGRFLVSDFGLNLSGWTLTGAVGISDDGTRIVGAGIDPAGAQESWLVTIPEPGSGLLLLAAFAFLRGRDHKGNPTAVMKFTQAHIRRG